jgi:hypothetical protein
MHLGRRDIDHIHGLAIVPWHKAHFGLAFAAPRALKMSGLLGAFGMRGCCHQHHGCGCE